MRGGAASLKSAASIGGAHDRTRLLVVYTPFDHLNRSLKLDARVGLIPSTVASGSTALAIEQFAEPPTRLNGPLLELYTWKLLGLFEACRQT